MADQNNNRPGPYLDENHKPYNNTETQSNPDNGDKQFKPNALDERTLRSVRSQTTFAYIAGPVSLFVGGILLGTVGTICALLAYRKLRALMQKSNETAAVARDMLKSTRTALIICLVAVALNAISFVIMFPVIEQMLQSGDFASVAGNMSAGTAAGSSTWG